MTRTVAAGLSSVASHEEARSCAPPCLQAPGRATQSEARGVRGSELERLPRRACRNEHSRGRGPHFRVDAVVILERPQHCEIRIDSVACDLPAAAQAPRELCLLAAQVGCDASDLAQSDLALKRLLQPGAAERGLPGMHSLEHERLREVRTLTARQQPRPQLVVLALRVRRVVPQLSAIDAISIHQHRRVEERRAEQREPTDARRTCGVAVQRARPAGLIEIEHGGTDNCHIF